MDGLDNSENFVFLFDYLLIIPRYLAFKVCIYYPGIKSLWVVSEMERKTLKTVVMCPRRPRNGKTGHFTSWKDENGNVRKWNNTKRASLLFLMLTMQICDVILLVVVVVVVVVVVFALAPTADCCNENVASK